VGENFDYGKKEEFLAVGKFYSWNISQFAQTSVFDLEIGKRIWFAKINQVVTKNDPNMPNLSKENLIFICIDVALSLLLFDVLAWIIKKGEIEREMSHNILVIKWPTHIE
jgi:hypothetical protein